MSQENFKLGKVFFKDNQRSADHPKCSIEIIFDDKFEAMLTQFEELYNDKKAVVRLQSYQDNMRFIMHLINSRKSGIEDEEK